MLKLKKRRKQKNAFQDRGSNRIFDVLSFFALFLLGFVVYECVICYATFGQLQSTAASQTTIVAPTERPMDIPVPLGTPLYTMMYMPTIVPTPRPTFPPMGLSAVPQPTNTPTSVSTPLPQPTALPTSFPQPTALPTSFPQPTSVPTSFPQPTPTSGTGMWSTVYSYTGNGAKQTPTISVPADWRIAYTCSGNTTVDGVLTVTVYNSSDQSPIDVGAVNTTCTVGRTISDVTEVHGAGQVYLDINSTADWTIQVQEKI